MKQGVINRYREYLPITEKTPVITLDEGSSPLIKAQSLSKSLGLEVYLKYEGVNPTGSFKDRGMTVAVSKAKEEGAKAVMCASTGNTAASAASYASRSDLDCIVLIPKGAIALGKLAQALMHGARVIAIEGNFDQALKLARQITDKYPIKLVNSINPYRIEGQKTAAFEICDELGKAPDYQCIPVGNAGNITAYWKGYKEYKEKGKIKSLPKMLGFQASGAAPIVEKRVIEKPETIATAIRIGNPASWKKAEEARDESGGLIDKVTDEKILEAYKLLASQEGVFVEPASAASVAGLLKLHRQGYFNSQKSIRPTGKDSWADQSPKSTVVCILTGHGLKDPDRAIALAKKPKVLPPTLEAVVKELGY